MFRRMIKAIFANLKTKLVALAIALAVWFYAGSQLTAHDKDITVALKLVPPPGYVLLAPSADSARLTISGPASIVSELMERQDYLKLEYAIQPADLPRAEGEAVELIPKAEWFQHGLQPWEVVQLRYSAITPKKVSAYASRLVTDRELPVEVVPAGIDAENLIKVEPAFVKVTGPAVVVDKMTSVRLQDEIRLYNLDLLPRRPLRLQSEQEVRLGDGAMVTVPFRCSPPRVTLMRAQGNGPDGPTPPPVAHVFANVPLMFLLPPQSPYRVQLAKDAPAKVNVLVKAKQEDIDRLKEAENQLRTNKDTPFLLAYVDLRSPPEKMAKGSPFHELVKVRMPPGVSAVDAKALDPRTEGEPLRTVALIVEEVVEERGEPE